MKYKDRLGNITIKSNFQEKIIKALYSHMLGRFFLRGAIVPQFSNILSFILKSRLSKVLIKPFINLNDIDMSEYEYKYFKSYNDFFTRQIKQQYRPINMVPNILISPCDGKVSVYKIDDNVCIKIKNSCYTIDSLLNNNKLAKEFCGGFCIVIRLSIDNYHHYCYPDNAQKSTNIFIPGKLHTVNPIAFKHYKVFKENSREYCILNTENFDKMVQMEIGALMVGKILNHDNCKKVKKGQEKGLFEFGGSTIVLLIKKDIAIIDNDILQNSKEGFETIVKMGEKIAIKQNQFN